MLQLTCLARLFRSRLVFALLSLPCASLASAQTTTPSSTPVVSRPATSVVVHSQTWDLGSVEAAVIAQINNARAMSGRGPVEKSDELSAAAQDLADFMARTGSFGHYADGRSPTSRAQRRKYVNCAVTENIAYTHGGYSGDALASHFVRVWRNSPGHNNNLMNSSMTQTGVGIARSSNGRYYAVQMFARPGARSIVFKVHNASPQSIEYQVAGDRYTLPPNTLRTHRRCRQSELVFDAKTEQTKAAESETPVVHVARQSFMPDGNDRFVVAADEQGNAKMAESES